MFSVHFIRLLSKNPVMGWADMHDEHLCASLDTLVEREVSLCRHVCSGSGIQLPCHITTRDTFCKSSVVTV
jgi:hypothetical protein